MDVLLLGLAVNENRSNEWQKGPGVYLLRLGFLGEDDVGGGSAGTLVGPRQRGGLPSAVLQRGRAPGEGHVLRLSRVGRAAMVGGIQAQRLILRAHPEQVKLLEDPKEWDHVCQHPPCMRQGE